MPSPQLKVKGFAREGLYSTSEVAWVIECNWKMTTAWLDARPEGVFWVGVGGRHSRRMTHDALMGWIESLPEWEQKRRLRLLAEVHEHRAEYLRRKREAVKGREVRRKRA